MLCKMSIGVMPYDSDHSSIPGNSWFIRYLDGTTTVVYESWKDEDIEH